MKSFFKILSVALLLCAFAASCGSDSTEPEPAPTPSVPEPDDKDDKIVVAENTDLSPTISQDGESKTIRFTAKKPWQASVDDARAAADWLHVSPASGEAGEAELTIAAERNETPDDRTGYVKIVSGNSSVTISVTQKQRDALTVSPSKKSIDAPETEFEIEVRANIQFEVEVKADWIEQISTRAMTTTVLKFKAKRNIGDERTGPIVIRSGDKSETITITQEKGDFIVDTAQFHIDASAQSVSANVRANIDFEVKPQAAWIHYNPTRAMTSYTLSFDIEENTTGKERTGEVTVSNGGKSETITITQSDVVFEMEFDKTEVPNEGGTITATVKSNMEYAIVLPGEVDWLTCVDTRAITTKTHNFKIEANPDLETRSAIIKFVYQSEKGEATKQVTITQQASDIGVDCALYELDANGGQVNVNVQGNTASASDIKYNIAQGAEWIHGTETRAVTAQFTFNIDKNTTAEPREGEIEFTLPDKAGIKVRIVQSAAVVDNTNIIHFPDANFKAYLVANFDKNKDGEISEYEASLITEIECSNKNIGSLEGIEYCTALTRLNCRENQLTTLDVSGCSALTTLYCDYNQLATLYVSGCSALEYLDCHYNQLTTLDVSKNSALTELKCSDNRLTLLDVSKNTALTDLNCGWNQLTTLDVSNNTALTSLDCDKNQLTILDVSKNTALTSLDCGNNPLEVLNLGDVNRSAYNFEKGRLSSSTKLKVISTRITSLFVSENKLQSLDVSECPALTFLSCDWNKLTTLDVSKNTKLKTLYCNWNQLTTLDVSNNTELIDLSCHGNQLTSLNVSGCSALYKLSCSSNILTSLNVSECSALTELYCDYNQLKTLDVNGCSTLTFLSCDDNQLTTLDISGCSALTSLSLSCSSNQLTTLDVSNNTVLSFLDCNSNQLTTLNVSGCSALTSLNCDYNQLTTLDVSGCPALTGLSCCDNPIEMLNLGEANPSFSHKHELSESYYGLLVSSTKLKVIGSKITNLHVSENKLQSLDISECPALTSLYCDENRLTTLDVSNNTALTVLQCGKNQLTTLDVSKNTALIDLLCYENQLTALDVSKNTALRTLQCYGNQLTTLDVSKTNLGNSSAFSPLDCSPMPTLQTLYLKTGQEINLININRDSLYIPEQTEILYKD